MTLPQVFTPLLTNMFSRLIQHLAKELPFYNCTNYQIIRECQSMSENMIEFFKNNEFTMQMKQITSSFTDENYSCNYYNHSNISKVISKHNADCLKIINFNIRSFEKNKFNLYFYLSTLPIQFDIIFLTETGRVNIEWAESIFEGYKFLYQPPSSNKGGAGMLIKTDSFDNFSEITNEKYCVKKTATVDYAKLKVSGLN